MRTLLTTLVFILFSGALYSSDYGADYKKEQFNIRVHTTDTLELYKLVNRSWEFRNTNLDSAFYYSDLGLELLNKFTHKKLESELLDNRSSLHQLNNNLDSAELLQLKALVIRTGIKDFRGLISSYKGLGNINKRLGKYKTALFYFSKALCVIDSVKFDFISTLNEKQSISNKIDESIEEINLLNGNEKENIQFISYASYIDFNLFKKDSQVEIDTEKDTNYYIIAMLLFLALSYITFHFYSAKS